MKMTKHGGNLVQLTRFPLLFPVNVFLVREEDGFTLIDAAVSGSAPAIIKAANALNGEIVRLALTHAHSDHIGSLDALIAALPNAELAMSAETARLLAEDREAKARKAPDKAPPALNPRVISPGDRVGSLEVVAAPGHSIDQIAFLDARDRTLIAGDAFQTRGGMAVSGTVNWSFPFPAFATVDKAQALETARALRALEPARLAVGHGDVRTSPSAAMDAAIRVAEAKVQKAPAHA
jgi:glyoxylase-like metal-dependent hydrolase (beta-lactamase superfamily II)